MSSEEAMKLVEVDVKGKEEPVHGVWIVMERGWDYNDEYYNEQGFYGAKCVSDFEDHAQEMARQATLNYLQGVGDDLPLFSYEGLEEIFSEEDHPRLEKFVALWRARWDEDPEQCEHEPPVSVKAWFADPVKIPDDLPAEAYEHLADACGELFFTVEFVPYAK